MYSEDGGSKFVTTYKTPRCHYPEIYALKLHHFQHLKSLSTGFSVNRLELSNDYMVEDIAACCLKAGISEAEQTSIASQRFDNTHIRGIAIARQWSHNYPRQPREEK
jgi:hypothetical protein